MAKTNKLIKVTFDISGHYPPRIVQKLSANLAKVAEKFVRIMDLGDVVQKVHVDSGKLDTFFSPDEHSIHLGEEMIRGIYALQLDSQARLDYYNWIWRDVDPIVVHEGYKYCTCEYRPMWQANIPVENRVLQVDLHMALIILHELTHACVWKIMPQPALICGNPWETQLEEDPHGEDFKNVFLILWRKYGKSLLTAVEKAGEVFSNE